MNFSSDNVSPICPEILAAIGEASDPALPYGADAASQQLDHAFSDLFGKEVAVVPVATGTAANLVGLSALVSPFGGGLPSSGAYQQDGIDRGGILWQRGEASDHGGAIGKAVARNT